MQEEYDEIYSASEQLMRSTILEQEKLIKEYQAAIEANNQRFDTLSKSITVCDWN